MMSPHSCVRRQEPETFSDGVIEVQAIGDVHRRGAALVITAIMTELGLYVQQAQGVTAIQRVRGFQRRIGHAAWYAINRDASVAITEERVNKVRAVLAVATSSRELKEWLTCTFVVKLVQSRDIPPRPFNAFILYSPLIAEHHSERKERWELNTTAAPSAAEPIAGDAKGDVAGATTPSTQHSVVLCAALARHSANGDAPDSSTVSEPLRRDAALAADASGTDSRDATPPASTVATPVTTPEARRPPPYSPTSSSPDRLRDGSPDGPRAPPSPSTETILHGTHMHGLDVAAFTQRIQLEVEKFASELGVQRLSDLLRSSQRRFERRASSSSGAPSGTRSPGTRSRRSSVSCTSSSRARRPSEVGPPQANVAANEAATDGIDVRRARSRRTVSCEDASTLFRFRRKSSAGSSSLEQIARQATAESATSQSGGRSSPTSWSPPVLMQRRKSPEKIVVQPTRASNGHQRQRDLLQA
jgi:hypothetical protein